MEPEPLLPPAQPLRPAQPAWRRLVQQHWPQYLAVAAVWLLMRLVDPIEPRPRAIYRGSDAEYWQASAMLAVPSAVRCPLGAGRQAGWAAMGLCHCTCCAKEEVLP